jgi:hypothetical protein
MNRIAISGSLFETDETRIFMIQIELYSNCWCPWKKPYYVMNNRKTSIYSHGSRPYWLFNDKLYFGIYQSFIHWEIQLNVAEGDFKDANMKSIRGHVDSFPHCQLLHWGSAKPQWNFFLPERDETIELTTKIEKNWELRTVHYFWDYEHVGRIVNLQLRDIITGRVAQIFVEPQYEVLLPHLLGAVILTGIGW